MVLAPQVTVITTELLMFLLLDFCRVVLCLVLTGWWSQELKRSSARFGTIVNPRTVKMI